MHVSFRPDKNTKETTGKNNHVERSIKRMSASWPFDIRWQHLRTISKCTENFTVVPQNFTVVLQIISQLCFRSFHSYAKDNFIAVPIHMKQPWSFTITTMSCPCINSTSEKRSSFDTTCWESQQTSPCGQGWWWGPAPPRTHHAAPHVEECRSAQAAGTFSGHPLCRSQTSALGRTCLNMEYI